MIGIVEIATATAATLAPYLPYIIKGGQAAGEKIAEAFGKTSGEAAWKKAGAIWNKIKEHFGEKPELEQAAGLVAMQPEDRSYQTALAKSIASYIETRTDLRQDLLNLLGGEEAIQKVLADKSSWIEDVTQDLQGTGTQTVEAANHSVIKNVKQSRKS